MQHQNGRLECGELSHGVQLTLLTYNIDGEARDRGQQGGKNFALSLRWGSADMTARVDKGKHSELWTMGGNLCQDGPLGIFHRTVIQREVELDQSRASKFGKRAKVARVSRMEASIGAWKRGEEVTVGDGINCTEEGVFEETKKTTGAQGEIGGSLGMTGDERTWGMAARIGRGEKTDDADEDLVRKFGEGE